MNLEHVSSQNFCEEDYLLANLDVAEAVNSGAFISGRFHFDQYGHKEGRFQRAPLIFFVHVPKTAGSSVNFHLKEHFPNGSAHCEAWIFNDVEMGQLDTLTWVSGHVRYTEAYSRVQQFTKRRVNFFGCIRYPTEQVRSHYNWLVEIFHRGMEYYESAPDDIKALSKEIRLSGSNSQAIKRILLGNREFFLNCQSSYLLGNESVVESALANFKLILTTDKLTDLLSTMIGAKIPALNRKNESPNHFDPHLFYSADMQSFLGRHNAQDEQLFARVQSRELVSSLYGQKADVRTAVDRNIHPQWR